MQNTSDLVKRITISSEQCGGRPCVRGLRIRVSDVLALLGAGASVEEILEDYPLLETPTFAPFLSTQHAKQITQC
jgi:uncharacterized protein (DUF433 family)